MDTSTGSISLSAQVWEAAADVSAPLCQSRGGRAVPCSTAGASAMVTIGARQSLTPRPVFAVLNREHRTFIDRRTGPSSVVISSPARSHPRLEPVNLHCHFQGTSRSAGVSGEPEPLCLCEERGQMISVMPGPHPIGNPFKMQWGGVTPQTFERGCPRACSLGALEARPIEGWFLPCSHDIQSQLGTFPVSPGVWIRRIAGAVSLDWAPDTVGPGWAKG